MKKFCSRIAADDFEIGSKMMASRSRPRRGEGPPRMEFMLQGAVMEIKALNLPYILVAASCPVRGRSDLVVDIRDHEFISVSSDFANAVFEAARPEPEESAEVAF